MFLVSFLTKSFLLKKTLPMTLKLVYVGIANIIPPIPNNNPPEIITINISRGWDLTELEKIYG